ncbi:MAG: 2-oxo acid dehydrogenase subunit E2, partial [Acidimicrobiales bacterium]|nr:2-oxo acid dehydrogenase subunit E2 [Acidimicrobiales bacterium]
ASEITPTGIGGRITREDVEKALVQKNSNSGKVSVPGVQKVGSRDEVVPFSNIRRRTAEHMSRSKRTSPHSLIAIEVDYEAVEQVKHHVSQSLMDSDKVHLTYLPFIARATVEALRAFPRLNASVGDDSLIVHHDIHLGIAVDLDGEGLIVPVIHNADSLSLLGMAKAIGDLAVRARESKLSVEEVVGGTFTITNPGPYGTLMTFPIINQPEVGILATDGIKRKPVVVESAQGVEAIAIHSVGNIGITYDHRALDGGYAAAFIARVAHLIATQDWSKEL